MMQGPDPIHIATYKLSTTQHVVRDEERAVASCGRFQ